VLSAADKLSQQFLTFVRTTTPTVNDVHQGQAGNCVILASIAAVTATGVNLASRITPLGNNLWSVPLYRPGTGWITQKVFFDGTWTANDVAPRGNGDFWVTLYNRAYLQEMGVWWTDPDSAHWGDKYGNAFRQIDRGLIALTGRGDWRGNGSLSTLQQADNSNRAVVALTHNDGDSPGLNLGNYGLVSDHAYTVLGVRTDSTGTWVTLRNPWGVDGPRIQGADDGIIQISWGTFSTVMQGYTVA
jgi:hypothetical protein